MNINRLVVVMWLVVLGLAVWLTIETVMTIATVGLTGDRPPLPAFQTGLRIVFGAGGLVFFAIRRDAWERVTGILGAAAAGSTTLFGFGWRSPALSAFRLLSHLALFALAAIVAGRALSRARAERLR